MPRAISAALPALALLAAARELAADGKGPCPQYLYTADQVNVIDDRIAGCVSVVPHVEASLVNLEEPDWPHDACRFEGMLELTHGVDKLAVGDVVVRCLRRRLVDANVTARVEQCLGGALAQDVSQIQSPVPTDFSLS